MSDEERERVLTLAYALGSVHGESDVRELTSAVIRLIEVDKALAASLIREKTLEEEGVQLYKSWEVASMERNTAAKRLSKIKSFLDNDDQIRSDNYISRSIQQMIKGEK